MKRLLQGFAYASQPPCYFGKNTTHSHVKIKQANY